LHRKTGELVLTTLKNLTHNFVGLCRKQEPVDLIEILVDNALLTSGSPFAKGPNVGVCDLNIYHPLNLTKTNPT